MNLALCVIIDGFSEYKPIVHKINDTNTKIRGLLIYSNDFSEPDPDYLYVVNSQKNGKAFSGKCPKHIIISGALPKDMLDKVETLIQIPQALPVSHIIQMGNAVYASYEAWYNLLLMAVINHKTIDVFLNIAAQKMANPLIVLNNNLGIISTAGSIVGLTNGTIWEKVNAPGFVMNNFYTPEEIRKISLHNAQKSEQILELHPKNDSAHRTLGIHIWIDGNLCGGIGTVDMNEPFTDGQKETLLIISQILKLYFQNHSIYMRLAKDKTNWVESLLDGVPANGSPINSAQFHSAQFHSAQFHSAQFHSGDISAEIISNYLHRFQWKIDDPFCIIAFAASSEIKIPIISILDIKQINDIFPDALVSVYDEHVVMIIKCADKQQPHGKKKQQLEQFLKKDIMLRCGISMVFNNFMHLRYYFTQSKYAASQCNAALGKAICSYEDCQTDHVLQTLSYETDQRCFCHPGILSLWESGNESKRDLVLCLYHYFLNGRNISAAANAIHVHRNTFIYRLGKAEEILNIDLKRPSEKQTFLFITSCMIVQNL